MNTRKNNRSQHYNAVIVVVVVFGVSQYTIFGPGTSKLHTLRKQLNLAFLV